MSTRPPANPSAPVEKNKAERRWLPATRKSVAELLRRARSGLDPDERFDLLLRAAILLPERPAVQRRLARALIDTGDLPQADAHTARCRRHWPDDVLLIGLRAEIALGMNCPQRAKGLIEEALARAPARVGLIRLAAAIERASGRPRAAAYHLGLAVLLRPDDPELARRLAETWLAAGDAERAARIVAVLPPREQHRELVAAIELGRRRPLEGLAQLGIVAGQDPGSIRKLVATFSEPEMMLALRLAEMAGRREMWRPLDEHARASGMVGAMLVTARRELKCGRLIGALRIAARGRSDARCGRDALMIVLVAAAGLGRERLSRTALHRLWQQWGGPDRSTLAQLWREARLGLAIGVGEADRRNRISAARGCASAGDRNGDASGDASGTGTDAASDASCGAGSGAGPGTGRILPGLLQSAAMTLERAAARSGEDEAHRRQLRIRAGACRAALGQQPVPEAKTAPPGPPGTSLRLAA